ncbi:uncharacterized protein LOC123429754 [Hordeum vulgare subsp. vulgare]|uniref:uncharacterized protein LOC123429754 n=1 Tax=Hordeum vulgare subsp. vulgare TaxID=112509 RepID=UPI001D1A5648|nr:uncharacterized protein LOC123429754 [Hordeum vulgare subsp. vulgare]
MWPRSWWPRWQAPSHARMEVPAGQNRAPSAVVDWRRVDLVEDDAQEHASHANTCSDGVPAALGTDDVQERLPTPWSVVAGDAEKKKKNKFEGILVPHLHPTEKATDDALLRATVAAPGAGRKMSRPGGHRHGQAWTDGAGHSRARTARPRHGRTGRTRRRWTSRRISP